MLGMQGSWRNTGCRLATCKRCGLLVGNLQALWLAGWQPANALARCEGCKRQATAENAGDARVLAQHRLQVGNLQALWLAGWQPAGAVACWLDNLQTLWLDVRVASVKQLQKMLGMQGSWRNTGCRLATCKRCGLLVGNLQALWLAGWQPANAMARCEGCKRQATAENAGDARVLAQHRLQVGNLQALWLAGWQPAGAVACWLATCKRSGSM